MSLSDEDLAAISSSVDGILAKHLIAIHGDILQIKSDLSDMKKDLNLLARLNQLDDIRKEPRLRALYNDDRREA